MNRFFRTMSLTVLALVALTACAGGSTAPDRTMPDAGEKQGVAEPLQVVTSFTILEDMVREIGGDLVTVHNLVPTGTDPHEYEPLPDDIRATAEADLLFFNGLNLEGGNEGWFARLVAAAGQPDEHVIEVSKGVTPMYLGDGESAEQMNPHAFIDPGVGMHMAEMIREALIAADPERADIYDTRAEEYIAEIDAIRADYAERLNAIPEDTRILVTSERAFQYLAAEYGITELFIWEIDTDENGSAQQIIDLVGALRGLPVSYLVMESNKDPRPMQMVSEEADIPIYADHIYSDEIGESGEEQEGTYLAYLTHNLDVLVGALGS